MNTDASAKIPDNPWKGLHFYTEADRSLFFGRDQETEEFLRLVRRDTLSILFARSGLGKTSFLRAAVIPRLREESFLPVIVRIDYAASAPPPALQIIEATLESARREGIDVDSDDETSPNSFIDMDNASLWEFFHRFRFWGPRNDPVLPILIIDQFEELFTLGRHGPYTEQFLTQLADLTENRMPESVQQRLEASGERLDFDTQARCCKIILSLREDFVPRLDALRQTLPSVMRNRFVLPPLDQDRAIDIVLRAGGRWVSDEVAAEIVKVVAGETLGKGSFTEIEPAYLSVMCHELFRRMLELGRDTIGLDLVSTEHGDILAGLYERSFEGLSLNARIFVEDRLLTDTGFRGSVPVAEAEREGVSIHELESLVDRRLLRFEDRFGTTHVELSHDLLTAIVQKSRDQRRAEAEREAERQREAQLQAKLRRERRRTLAWAALALLLLVGIGFYAYGWWFPYQTYCRNFTKRWGVPQCVGALPKEAVAHRASTIRLSQQGRFGPLLSMEIIDANRQLTGQHSIGTYLDPEAKSSRGERKARYEFVYNRKGWVVYEVAWDRFGRMKRGFAYAPDVASADRQPRFFIQDIQTYINRIFANHEYPKSRKGMFLGPDGYPQPQSHSRAEFVEIVYDGRGYETELRYKDREGRPAPGPDNAYGLRMEYDMEGRLTRHTSLNERGEPMNDAAGNAGQELVYDQYGNLIEGRAFDAKGEPTLVNGGFHRAKYDYDKWGRWTEARFFNLNGGAATFESWGAHWVVLDYDDHGNVTSIRLYNYADRPTKADAILFDFTAHEQRITYDLQNRPVTVAYYDQDGRPMAGPEGWHLVRLEYDQKSFVSARSYFDTQDKPINLKSSGYHRWQLANNEFGQPVEERFFDANGNAVAILDGGYHLRKNEYDKAGNRTVQSYFDAEGRPVADQTNGAHRYVKRFDRFGNPVLTLYFNESGQPIDNKSGFHKEVSNYDDYGSVTETRWYDKDDHPVAGPDGVHRINYEYNERGLRTRIIKYDDHNQPVVDKQGIHKILFAWNDKQQRTKWQAFGLNGQPAEDKDGNHLILNEFDERGREIRVTQLRADGSPNWIRELGIATRRRVYDDEKQWIQEAYYDEKDRLVPSHVGYAKATSSTDSDGRLVITFYDRNGKPWFNPLAGYAISKTDPRERGETVDSYHDADGNPIAGPEGWAEKRRHWDNVGTLLGEAYFGPDGTPVVGPDGWHSAKFVSGEFPDKVHYFDSKNHKLPSFGPESFVAVIYVTGIKNIYQPAARAGIQAGDIFWRYGAWSFSEAWQSERPKGIKVNEIAMAVWRKFLAERNRMSDRPVTMTVIRHGRPVELTVPPLPGKMPDAHLELRMVPVATFKAWKAAADNKN